MYFVQGWMKEKMRIIAFLFAGALVKEKKNKEKKSFYIFLVTTTLKQRSPKIKYTLVPYNIFSQQAVRDNLDICQAWEACVWSSLAITTGILVPCSRDMALPYHCCGVSMQEDIHPRD